MAARAQVKKQQKAAAGKAAGSVGADSLERYREKRRFRITSEPEGRRGPARSKALRFVVQQHDARRMHFDFRLELDGVLKSWAVPKGPSLSPQDKRLAVEVEDHPLDYRDFEGTIPEGEYGAGAVIVWDRGTWSPEGDAHAALAKGHLDFSVHGEKLSGRFALVRMHGDRRGGTKTNWLLIKGQDEHARNGEAAEITQRERASVASGRTVEEVAGASAAKPARKLAKTAEKAAAVKRRGKAQAPLQAPAPALADIGPQLATLVDRPPPSEGYLFEVKFDGYRALSHIAKGTVSMRSRNQLNWSDTFPGINRALARLAPHDVILDGEICFVTREGLTNFQRLQETMGTRGNRRVADDSALAYFVFDLLFLDGADLRARPLAERKALLEELLKGAENEALRYSKHLEGEGRTVLAQACKLGLEGVIAKRSDAPYREGRSPDWLKLKCTRRQEFVIAGYSRAEGARVGFRSLVLGLREGAKGLRYAGSVGTGFSEQSLRDIARELKKRHVDAPLVEGAPKLPRTQWVKPDLVCEVAFSEMTRDGVLRHPSFQGLRQDKEAAEVHRERARPAPGKPVRASAPAQRDVSAAGVRITHPERVMDESSGITKGELARYYERVADAFLAFAARRPMALVRCPQGDAHQCFFQKHVMPGVGPSVHGGRAAGQEMLYIEDARGLLELVQFNAVEFHGWGVRIDALTQPDWLVFDLDPDEALPFSTVVEAAIEVREALQAVELESFVKTTGGKGLHVVVPLRPQAQWAPAKEFARALAETLAARDPKRYVANMSKARRSGRIFIDYLRNGEGATAVLPYSSRARPGAGVALPLAWKDLKGLDPREFRVQNADKWLRRRGDPWKGFWSVDQVLPLLPPAAKSRR